MKNLKKILVGIMASVMIVLTVGTVAFAADDIRVDIKKELSVITGSVLPDEAFTFTVTPRTDITTKYGTTTLNYFPGVDIGTAGTVTIGKADLGLESQAGGFSKYVGTKDIDFAGVTFTKPGVYAYLVKETEGSITGMTYDSKTYNLDIYVAEDDEGDLAPIIAISKNAATDEKAAITFGNILMTNNLTVNNKVTGNQGERDRQFEYTGTISAKDGVLAAGSVLEGTITRNSGATEDITFVVGTPKTFTLAHGEKLVLGGVPADVEYSVTETDYSTEGYTTSVDGEDSSVKTGKMEMGGVVTTFTNKKDVSTPTGVALNVLPFVLILAIALIAVVFVFKKRKSTEE